MPRAMRINRWENLDGEEWRAIPVYTPYMVSNMGRIKDDKNRLIISVSKQKTYKSIAIPQKGIYKTLRIHRLVLEVFDRLPKSYEVARHLNGIETDNRLENLAWGTQSQNAKDAFEHNRRKRPNTRLDKEKVKFIRGCEYHRGLYKKLSEKFNIHESTIRSVREYRSWKTI
jgi:hypothetical protein